MNNPQDFLNHLQEKSFFEIQDLITRHNDQRKWDGCKGRISAYVLFLKEQIIEPFSKRENLTEKDREGFADCVEFSTMCETMLAQGICVIGELMEHQVCPHGGEFMEEQSKTIGVLIQELGGLIIALNEITYVASLGGLRSEEGGRQ